MPKMPKMPALARLDYVFDIKPNAVQGRNKMKANIKVECHYTPQEDLNAASMNKEFATFLPMVA